MWIGKKNNPSSKLEDNIHGKQFREEQIWIFQKNLMIMCNFITNQENII